MSNPLRAVGKAFKKVVKVVKKVALPVLAVGAVVLTAGAALGALPAVGSVLGSIGIKGALAGVLTSAAKAATFGAVGSLLTGGNPIKGATQGFLLGGAIGGLNALAAPAMAGGSGAAAGSKVAMTGTEAAQSAGTGAAKVASGTSGLGTAATSASVPGEAAVRSAWGVGAPSAVAAPAASVAPAASLAPVASAAVPTSGGGLGSFIGNMHPMVQGQMIAGIGQGLAANEDAKDRRRERREIEANYADTSGFFRLDQTQRQGLGNLQPAAERYSQSIYGKSRLTYDPATGRVVAVGG